jgi:hypothetical protein
MTASRDRRASARAGQGFQAAGAAGEGNSLMVKFLRKKSRAAPADGAGNCLLEAVLDGDEARQRRSEEDGGVVLEAERRGAAAEAEAVTGRGVLLVRQVLAVQADQPLLVGTGPDDAGVQQAVGLLVDIRLGASNCWISPGRSSWC